MSEGRDFYEPLWVKIEKLSSMLVYPLEIRDLLIEDFENNFNNPVNEAFIKISDLKQSL